MPAQRKAGAVEKSLSIDLIRNNTQIKYYDARRKPIKIMTAKNIIEKNSEDSFSFTAAYRVFIDLARELAENRTTSSEQNDK